MPAAVPSAASKLPPHLFDKTRSGGLRRKCPTCKQEFPTEQFPCLPDSRCERCIPPDVMERKRVKQLDKATRDFAKVLDLCGGAPAEVPRQSQLLGEIFREWGGFAEFAHDIVRAIQHRLTLNPGDGQAINAGLKLMKMNLENQRLEHQIDVDQMTDQQLRAQRQLQAFEVLAEIAKDRAYAAPLLRILKDNGLPISEAIIEEFAVGDETKRAAVEIAIERGDIAEQEVLCGTS